MTDNKSVFAFHPENDRRSNCLFAVPKKGRLYEKCLKVLEGSGIEYDRPNRLDVAYCTSLPLTIVFLPAADIAKYVAEGNVDIGITGTDVVQESDVQVDTIFRLGFGKCKLCVQAPVSSPYKTAEELSGKRIVTSFPFLTKQLFDKYDTPDRQTSLLLISTRILKLILLYIRYQICIWFSRSCLWFRSCRCCC